MSAKTSKELRAEAVALVKQADVLDLVDHAAKVGYPVGTRFKTHGKLCEITGFSIRFGSPTTLYKVVKKNGELGAIEHHYSSWAKLEAL